jgi:hypothetical protein
MKVELTGARMTPARYRLVVDRVAQSPPASAPLEPETQKAPELVLDEAGQPTGDLGDVAAPVDHRCMTAVIAPPSEAPYPRFQV